MSSGCNLQNVGRSGCAGIVWMLVGVAGLAGSVSTASADEQDALGGPKVRDNSVQGERRTLTGKGDPKVERAGRLQPRLFERALGVLRAEDAPAELKLSAEQGEKVDAIREEFLSQVRSYIDEHREEIESLREKLPQRERGRVDQFLRGGHGADGERAKRPGDRRPGDAPPPPERRDEAMDEGGPMIDSRDAEAVKARLKELLDGAPKPADAHARVMAILSDAQREAVNKEVERLQKEAVEHGRNDKGEKGKREELREELLKNLTAEEREKLMGMSPEERREHVKQRIKERGK